MNRNEIITREKINSLSSAISNIARLEEFGDDKKGRTVKIGIHYLTLANALASKILNHSNTKFSIKTANGVKLIVTMGEPIKQINILIEKGKLSYEK